MLKSSEGIPMEDTTQSTDSPEESTPKALNIDPDELRKITGQSPREFEASIKRISAQAQEPDDAPTEGGGGSETPPEEKGSDDDSKLDWSNIMTPEWPSSNK